ncbi:MAG: hypothetical protein Q4E12_02165 [Coriobacteriia bacterium]|nr:hypothetical protein [Coriobacteriia bacterium]
MQLIVRLIQSIPLVIVLVVLAVVVYVFVSWAKSPLRAKEILIKLFLVLTGVLTAITLLATLYGVLERNENAAWFFAALLIVSAVALCITLVCRWRFRTNHPHYRNKPQHSRTKWRYEDVVKNVLEALKNARQRGR